jgi:hypothetical protein
LTVLLEPKKVNEKSLSATRIFFEKHVLVCPKKEMADGHHAVVEQ